MSEVLASGINLKKVSHPNNVDVLTDFHYEVWSQIKDTTFTLDVKFQMQTHSPTFEMTADFGEVKVPSVDAGFDKLADWMERTAKVLRERKAIKSVPIFNQH